VVIETTPESGEPGIIEEDRIILVCSDGFTRR
jgi:hypothetical protein